MSSIKRWRSVGGGGDFHKWMQAGEALEGTWRGIHDGQYGPVGTLETPEGLVRFAVTTALLDRLQPIAEGTGLRVEYLGVRRSKVGREYKDFAVWVAEDVPPEALEPDPFEA